MSAGNEEKSRVEKELKKIITNEQRKKQAANLEDCGPVLLDIMVGEKINWVRSNFYCHWIIVILHSQGDNKGRWKTQWMMEAEVHNRLKPTSSMFAGFYSLVIASLNWKQICKAHEVQQVSDGSILPMGGSSSDQYAILYPCLGLHLQHAGLSGDKHPALLIAGESLHLHSCSTKLKTKFVRCQQLTFS